jgi:hypothetical protein
MIMFCCLCLYVYSPQLHLNAWISLYGSWYVYLQRVLHTSLLFASQSQSLITTDCQSSFLQLFLDSYGFYDLGHPL